MDLGDDTAISFLSETIMATNVTTDSINASMNITNVSYRDSSLGDDNVFEKNDGMKNESENISKNHSIETLSALPMRLFASETDSDKDSKDESTIVFGSELRNSMIRSEMNFPKINSMRNPFDLTSVIRY